MIKTIEKAAIFLILINIGVWIFNYYEQIDSASMITGFISILIGYSIVYILIWTCLKSYAKELLEKTTKYFQKNYEVEKIEFNSNFYEEVLRQFMTYILIMFLLLDLFTLIKFKFSVLSVVNNIISSTNNE